MRAAVGCGCRSDSWRQRRGPGLGVDRQMGEQEYSRPLGAGGRPDRRKRLSSDSLQSRDGRGCCKRRREPPGDQVAAPDRPICSPSDRGIGGAIAPGRWAICPKIAERSRLGISRPRSADTASGNQPDLAAAGAIWCHEYPVRNFGIRSIMACCAENLPGSNRGGSFSPRVCVRGIADQRESPCWVRNPSDVRRLRLTRLF